MTAYQCPAGASRQRGLKAAKVRGSPTALGTWVLTCLPHEWAMCLFWSLRDAGHEWGPGPVEWPRQDRAPTPQEWPSPL